MLCDLGTGKHDAVATVEASWIMAITIMLILMTLTIAFKLYEWSLDYISGISFEWSIKPEMLFRISEIVGE